MSVLFALLLTLSNTLLQPSQVPTRVLTLTLSQTPNISEWHIFYKNYNTILVWIFIEIKKNKNSFSLTQFKSNKTQYTAASNRSQATNPTVPLRAVIFKPRRLKCLCLAVLATAARVSWTWDFKYFLEFYDWIYYRLIQSVISIRNLMGVQEKFLVLIK